MRLPILVIDKKLFSRVIKNRSSKLADKALLPKIQNSGLLL